MLARCVSCCCLQLQLQKAKGQPGSSSITLPAPKRQPAAAVKPPAGKSAARAAAAASHTASARKTARKAAAAAAAEADALAALDCLAAVAAGEEVLPPDCGTPAHRGTADPHGLQQQVRCLWHTAVGGLHSRVMLLSVALWC
jgi:hypothetical protein